MPDIGSLLDHPGMDTWLARWLDQRRTVTTADLQQVLAEARGARGQGPTLARRLAQRGLVAVDALEEALGSLVTATAVTLKRPSWSGSLDVGATIGGYEVVRELGAGGMGRVYEVRDPHSGGHYALKTIAIAADPELTLRFQREGEAQGRVGQHPNVVTVHKAGAEDGQAFLVMDLEQGGDLEQRLRQGPLEPTVATRVVRDLARGLAHVHAKGVLHRDIKPANILFDEVGTPKLVDFGLATCSGTDRLTQSGTLLGTPAYMAPEQARGDTHQIEARTDVYALGAVLYECLSGSPPFPGGAILFVLKQVLNDPPPAPSTLAPDIPEALEALCLQALSKELDDRPASAEAFAEALEALLEGAPLPGRPDRTRRRFALALAGAVLFAAGGALGSALAPRADPPAPAVQSGPSSVVPVATTTRAHPPNVAQLLRRAREDAPRDPEAAARHVQRAFELDGYEAACAEPDIAEILLDEARRLLQSPLTPTGATRVRRALIRARLLLQREALPQDLLSQLLKLVDHADPAVRSAALPAFSTLNPGRRVELRALLRKTVPVGERLAIDARSGASRGWRYFLLRHRATVGLLRTLALTETILLWRPEIPLAWYCLLVIASDEGVALDAGRRAADQLGRNAPRCRWRLAHIAKWQGRLEEAALKFESVLTAFGPKRSAWIRYEYGRVLLDLGRQSDGLTQIQLVSSGVKGNTPLLGPLNSRRYWELLIDLLESKGERTMAGKVRRLHLSRAKKP